MSIPPLSLCGAREGERALIEVAGELDLATAGEFESYLVRLIDDGARYVVVDFANLDFCDCRGLAALATAQHHLHRYGARGWVRLARPTALVARLCRLAEFSEIVGVYGSLAEARSAPSAAPPPQPEEAPGSTPHGLPAAISPSPGEAPLPSTTAVGDDFGSSRQR